MDWITPIFDRIAEDTASARINQGNSENNKGALNYQDLNRIEGNHKELMKWLKSSGYYLPCSYRDYKEFNGKTYTDWQEENIPWLSEINRIRANYTALVRLFLVGLDLPVFEESDYVDWQEVNDWERVADMSKKMYEKMKAEYIFCGTTDSGGARLL